MNAGARYCFTIRTLNVRFFHLLRAPQIRPWALGRKNWLFAGSLRSGKRSAAIMSLIQSARNNGHDPYAYLKDVLTRLPTQQASEIANLLPHNWRHSSMQKASSLTRSALASGQ